MGDPLSTDDVQETKKYDTLEGMIKYDWRVKEEEVPHTIRLEAWQLTEVDRIKNYLNTNRVEVIERAYRMGTDILRERTREDVVDITKMRTVFTHISMNTLHQSKDVHDIINDVLDIEVQHNYDSGAPLKEPIYARLRESYFSEVQDTYCVDAKFGGWIHRVIIGLGLTKSSNLSSVSEQHADGFLSGIVEGVDDTRVELENVIRKYVGLNSMYWMQHGIEVETYSGLEEVYKHMETEHKEAVKEFLNIDGLEKIKGPGEPPPG